MEALKKYDVLIIGGGLSGLLSAYVSSSYGFKTILFERSSSLGGNNQSYEDDAGNIFDMGYHALDENRSRVATAIFKKSLGSGCLRHQLCRGIIMGDSLMDYNLPYEEWSSPFSEILKKPEGKTFVDNTEPPIKPEVLSEIYGSEFVDHILKNALNSYPTNKWSLENGGPLTEHIEMVYPWFFPKHERSSKRGDESVEFHDSKRNEAQYVLYPEGKGFGAFIEGLHDMVKDKVEIVTDCGDIEFNFSSKREFDLESISVGGADYGFNHVFWCAPMAGLFKLFNLSMPKGEPQKVISGCFEVKNDFDLPFHEILVADTRHKINRIGFPNKLRGMVNKLIQTEVILPQCDYDAAVANIESDWVKSLRDTGILKSDNEVVNYYYKEYNVGFAVPSFKETSAKMKDDLASVDTNIFVPFPMLGPENINRLMPSVVKNTTIKLTEN